jgi:fructose-1,6-bisphosphatase/inositol monophosphatase family enzyme
LLVVDLIAERNTARRLRRAFGGKSRIHVLGEESLRNPALNLAGENRLVALLDMVDGTDLLARGLSNWCSAMIFYQRGRILAAFIGVPQEGVYFATHKTRRAFKKPPGRAGIMPVRGPNHRARLNGASLCYYGQKLKNFLAVTEHEGLRRALEALRSAKPGPRIYNLAGNPMMMRLIDGNVRMDAVFDIEGQLPHDVIPGAYIAQRAGATLRDLNGKDIDLARSLLKPAHNDSELKYVLAASKTLCSELVRIMRTKAAGRRMVLR